jgi:sugar O-acyltransferase (sialic acid O-acetyltransferase NeuD family)
MVVYGLLDDAEEKQGLQVGEVSVMGKSDDQEYLRFIGNKCDAFIAFDDNRLKKSTVKMLKNERKAMPVNAIHQQAYIAGSAFLGYGNFINAGVMVGTNAKIANHCIINTNVVIDHHASLGDFVQIGAGSIINSGVVIENEAFVGSGVTIVSGVTIEKGARVGAGSVVISSVKAGETVFGNPAASVE